MPPIITLTTDFGTSDPYVAVMKGVILGIAPQATIVDLTHAVPPQDVLAGAYLLRNGAGHFPPGTIHVAVIDPAVGTARRALLIVTKRAYFLAPDNGLVTFVAPARETVAVLDIGRSPYALKRQRNAGGGSTRSRAAGSRPVPGVAPDARAIGGRTFDGRDIFAPVAAHLAAGVEPAALGRPAAGLVRLRTRRARRNGRALRGEVLWIDHFGNAITNITATDLHAAGAFRGTGVSVTIADHVLRVRPSYAAVAAGRPLALVNSADLLEIAVNQGSAVERLQIRRGTPVVIARR